MLLNLSSPLFASFPSLFLVYSPQDSFPARFGGIHFVNQPWYIHAMYTIIKPFLKDKTRKRVKHTHLPPFFLWLLLLMSSLFISYILFSFVLISSPLPFSLPSFPLSLISSNLSSFLYHLFFILILVSSPQIFLHGNNLNSLHQLIQPECLPSEFGGTLPPYDMGIWARTLLGPDYNDETEYTLTYDALHVRENCGGGGDKEMMKR